MSTPIRMDGSFGEGGGQIIRTCVSLAAMTGRAVEITNVRARRTRPGLQPQHLAAVRAAAALCGARLKGDSVGSMFLLFEPQDPVTAGDYHFDIGTAGAAPLVAQTVLVPLSRAGSVSNVSITGGTHMPHSPPVDYLETVYVPLLQRAGIAARLDYSCAGFYPRGGGKVELNIQPSPAIAPLDLVERGRLKNLTALIVTANLPVHVAERGASTIEDFMKGIGRDIVIERREKPSPGPGAAVVVTTQCENGMAGFSAIGELRKPMEKVAAAPGKDFMRWWKSGAACDEHLADQLVLPLCFANGESRWTTPVITAHLRTIIWVAQHFLPVEADLKENEDGTGTVRLRGIGS